MSNTASKGGRQRLAGTGSGASPKRQVRLSEDLNFELDRAARAEGLSASELIRQAITERLRQHRHLVQGSSADFTDDPVVLYDVMCESLYALKGHMLTLADNAPNETVEQYWVDRVASIQKEKDGVDPDDIAAMREHTDRWVQLRADLENSFILQS